MVASYRPSVASRFVAWVDLLPLRGLWVAPALALALFAWGHAVLWASGRLPVGTIDLTVTTGVVYGPYVLAVFAITNRVAARSLHAFWPATGWPDSERPRWLYRFVTLPRGGDLLALAIGIPISIGAFLGARLVPGSTRNAVVRRRGIPSEHDPRLQRVPAHRPPHRAPAASGDEIDREATAIDPFDREPVYAFSRLTVVTGLAYVLVGYYGLAVNGAFQAGNVVSIVTLVGSFAVGMVTFVVPLWGIHDRLVHEKAQLVAQGGGPARQGRGRDGPPHRRGSVRHHEGDHRHARGRDAAARAHHAGTDVAVATAGPAWLPLGAAHSGGGVHRKPPDRRQPGGLAMTLVLDYIELAVGDLSRAKDFYSKAMGWTFTDYGADYAGLQDPRTPGKEFGGLSAEGADAGGAGGVLALASTDDADAAVIAVQNAGGRIVVELHAYPGGRRFTFADPWARPRVYEPAH